MPDKKVLQHLDKKNFKSYLVAIMLWFLAGVPLSAPMDRGGQEKKKERENIHCQIFNCPALWL